MKAFLPFALAIAMMLAAATAALGQKEPVKATSVVSPTGVSMGLPFYSVDDAMRLKIREFEFKSDQLEIEIQRMKVKIEEDKAAESAIWKEIATAAAKYAQEHAIDPDRNDFDAAEVKYVQKHNVPLIPATVVPEKARGMK